jgi:hypothetical protein
MGLAHALKKWQTFSPIGAGNSDAAKGHVSHIGKMRIHQPDDHIQPEGAPASFYHEWTPHAVTLIKG